MTSVPVPVVVEKILTDSAGARDRPTERPWLDLKSARERSGVSLAFIALHTKIPLSILNGLERGDFHQFPRGIYARGYVRAYAAAVRMPVDAVLASLRDCLPPDESFEQICRAKAEAEESCCPGDGGRVLRAMGGGSALLAAILTVVWVAGPPISSVGGERGPSQRRVAPASTAVARVANPAVAPPVPQQQAVAKSRPESEPESPGRLELPGRRSAGRQPHSDAPQPSQTRVGTVRAVGPDAPDPLPAKPIDVALLMPAPTLESPAITLREQRQAKLTRAFKTFGGGFARVLGRSGSSE